MSFHVLRFADAGGNFLKPDAARPRVQIASKNLANVTALK